MKDMIQMFCMLLLTYSAQVSASLIHGIEFPNGIESFADRVSSSNPGSNTLFPYSDPNSSLGVPDYDGGITPYRGTSLGNGGVLVVEFSNNFLVDQDSVEGGLDLFVFEAGDEEPYQVEISTDGIVFINIGTGAGLTGFDISSFSSPGEEFFFVRITDLNGGMSNHQVSGADIDAVGAIGETSEIPMPGTIFLFCVGYALALLLKATCLSGDRAIQKSYT